MKKNCEVPKKKQVFPMKKNCEVHQTICGRAYILPQNPASRNPAVPTFSPHKSSRNSFPQQETVGKEPFLLEMSAPFCFNLKIP